MKEIPEGWVAEKDLISELGVAERLVNENIDRYQIENGDEVMWANDTERFVSPDIAAKIRNDVQG